MTYFYSDRKVAQPIPDTRSICQEVNYIENIEQNQCYIKCCKCPPRSVSLLNKEGRPERFLSCTLPVTETVHQAGYCRFVWHGEIEKCDNKLILES
jgi:hypothetical protein